MDGADKVKEVGKDAEKEMKEENAEGGRGPRSLMVQRRWESLENRGH